MHMVRTVAAAALILGALPGANAQSDYPNKPITLVLPLGAGGAMDILARGQFAPKLSERLGKPVVIENRTGGGTVIAATTVAKSPPDGYTLFFVPAGTLTTNATLYKSLPYDPGKDFVPIALTSKLGFVLAVNPSTPVNSLAELVAYVKQRPGQLSYGSTGIGATPHLAFEMFERAAGLKMTHVPYRGMPQATSDVVAGHIQMVFTDPPLAQSLVTDGKLRALAVSTLERIPAVPTVPSLNELGVQGFRSGVVAHDRGAGRHAEADRRPAAHRIQSHRRVAGIPAAGPQDGPERDRLGSARGAQTLSRRGNPAVGRSGEADRHRRDAVKSRPGAAGSAKTATEFRQAFPCLLTRPSLDRRVQPVPWRLRRGG